MPRRVIQVDNTNGTVTHTTGALTADLPLFGNGGGDIKVGTKTGNTDTVVTASGAKTQGYPILWDANANAVAGLNYGADTGAANAYILTLTTPPAAYYAGMDITVLIVHANTGASTINVNTLGVKSIKKESSSGLVDLAANDFQAGQIAKLTYDGMVFQVVGGSVSAASVNWVSETPSGTLDGTNTTFTLSHAPAAGSFELFLNGVRQIVSIDYTISGSTITFNEPPLSIDEIYATYTY